MTQLSVEQLKELYPNADQRECILRLHALKSFLSECVIDRSYKVSDGLHTPLVLSKYGDRVAEKLRKQGVPFPESRLLCLLEMLGPEPLIDVDRTNVDTLHQAIHRQIKSGELAFAFRFGRTMYDKFNSVYREEKISLSNKESRELLHLTPQGVFQVGDYISGPYGLIKGTTPRTIYPTTAIPLQLCSDRSCSRVHTVGLETSQEAAINENRSKIRMILDRDGGSIDPWMSFFESFRKTPVHSEERRGEAVIELIGDALTDEELRLLLNWLLDHTSNDVRRVAQTVGVQSGKSESMTRSLDRAQMMQLICVAKNKSLILALDTLVSNGSIVTPEGEVRSAVINRGSTYGQYGLFAELNRFGVRLQSDRYSIAPLRLRQLVEKMYNFENEGDRQELLWQLRARPDESVDRHLQRHVQSENPRWVVEKLALARRSNVIVASEYLNFTESHARTDQILIDTIVWKLGFPIDNFSDANAELFAIHDQILLALRQNDSEPHDEFYANLRGLCANYFVKLEEILRDSISYATWALTTDHYFSRNPYSYRADTEGTQALLSLNKASEGDAPDRRVVYGDPPTLYAVCRGYERLSVILTSMLESRESWHRSDDEKPQWASVESLQKFPFDHRSPFLDLADEAQDHILERLREVSKLLVGSDPSALRSEMLHPRPSHTDLERLRSGLETIREALVQLESDGFCRITFNPSFFEGDAMARQRVVLSHRRGYMHTLYMPSNHAWLRMPHKDVPQYVMSSARLKNSTEVLRFTSRVDSPFERMYEDYPKRPSSSNRSRAEQTKAVQEAE